MSNERSDTTKFRVLVVGGGVAAIETILALADLAGDAVEVKLIAPNEEFVYRPMTVREPFSYGGAHHYPLAPIARDAGAELIADELARIEPEAQKIHTKAGAELGYDALVLALGATAKPHYEHATTIDDHRLDALMHGIVQDVEGGYIQSLAFVSPGRMAWPMPLYELALMTAGRAYDMDEEVAITIVTPEESPLAIFGAAASEAVGELLERSQIHVITSAYAEIPRAGELIITPGDRHLHVNRVIALPELYGPGVRGIPLAEHGFIPVDQFGRVHDAGPIYAAGDSIAFAVKHGGLATQEADVAAQSVAALAGAPVTPEAFDPVVRGILLTADKPLYLTAEITGGHGFSSQITDEPTWSPPMKIAARYLAPYLDARDHEASST
jgi:sulfide:quinone oxidoreductase